MPTDSKCGGGSQIVSRSSLKGEVYRLPQVLVLGRPIFATEGRTPLLVPACFPGAQLPLARFDIDCLGRWGQFWSVCVCVCVYAGVCVPVLHKDTRMCVTKLKQFQCWSDLTMANRHGCHFSTPVSSRRSKNVMSLALCPQVEPKSSSTHVRSSET